MLSLQLRLGQGLLVELHIQPHYWLLGIGGRPHTLFGPLIEILGPTGFLWLVDWTNRPFGPSMAYPPSFVLHCCELYNEVGQCFGLNCSPQAILYVELTQLYHPQYQSSGCLRIVHCLSQRFVHLDCYSVCLKIQLKPTGGYNQSKSQLFHGRIPFFCPSKCLASVEHG